MQNYFLPNLIKINKLCSCESFIKDKIKEIFSNLGCLDNETIQKIDSDNYADIIQKDALIDGIKKQDIFSIVNNLSLAGSEDINKRVLILKNVDATSKEFLNSLLKFIESPPSNTLIFLTCRSTQKIPQTILSRCQLINLKKDSEKINEIFLKSKLSKNEWKIIEDSVWDLNYLDNNFETIINMLDLGKKMSNNDYKLIHKNFLEFKKLTYDEIKTLIIILSNIIDDFKIKFNLIELSSSFNSINKNLLYNKLIILIGGSNE